MNFLPKKIIIYLFKVLLSQRDFYLPSPSFYLLKKESGNYNNKKLVAVAAFLPWRSPPVQIS